MLEDVRYTQNSNISKDEARINSSDLSSKKNVSFRAVNPNAVDTTPTADTYTQPGQEVQPEMSFGEKFTKYGLPAGASLYLLSEFFDKANRGEYEKSLLGRLGRFGDWLSGTKLLNNSFVDWLSNKTSEARIKGQAFIDRHETLSAMQKTPTKPTCPLVTNFLETQNEADLKLGVAKLKEYFEKNPKTLKLSGASESEINALKAKYGTGLFGRINNERKAVEEYLINKIGTDIGRSNIIQTVEGREAALARQLEKYQTAFREGNLTPEARNWTIKRINQIRDLQSNYRAATLKNLKFESMNLNAPTLEAMAKNPTRYAGNIELGLENAARYSPRMSEFYNKIKSATAPATKLGKFLPKAAKLGIRGLTFGGGLLNCMLMLSFFMMDAVKNTIDAPKDQKVATGVHGFFDAISWVIAMPLALKGMHAVNGLKNLGKTESQVKTYEAAYEAFKKKANACGFASKAEYDTEWAAVKQLKNAGTKPKGFKWVLSKLASFTSIGLEQKPAYKEPTAPLNWGLNIKNVLKPNNLKKVGGNLARLSRNFPKNWVGYPLRFALYMFAFQPVVDKLFTTPIKAIFGKPYEPEAIAEQQEKEKQQAELEELRKRFLYPGPSISPNPNAVSGLNDLNIDSVADDNLVKQELIKRGLANSSQKFNTIEQNDGYFNSANGVQIDIRNGDKPFMPADNRSSNGVNINNNSVAPDPNKSDYDTVPRSFVPQIDRENPVPYSDPFTNPNYERNYDKMRESIEKSEKFIAETEKWIDNKFED